jgi:hypothetical protein
MGTTWTSPCIFSLAHHTVNSNFGESKKYVGASLHYRQAHNRFGIFIFRLLFFLKPKKENFQHKKRRKLGQRTLGLIVHQGIA